MRGRSQEEGTYFTLGTLLPKSAQMISLNPCYNPVRLELLLPFSFEIYKT